MRPEPRSREQNETSIVATVSQAAVASMFIQELLDCQQEHFEMFATTLLPSQYECFYLVEITYTDRVRHACRAVQ